MQHSNTNKLKQYIVLFHSLPGSYSVEINDNFHPTADSFKSSTNAFFHNYFVGDFDNGVQFAFYYNYQTSKNGKESFKLDVYKVSDYPESNL